MWERQKLFIAFRRKEDLSPLIIKGQQVEVVDTHKYLAVFLDNKLNWKNNTDVAFKKAQLRLFFFHEKSEIL